MTLRLQIAKYSTYVYGVESMLYMTAGLMDLYERTSIDVETAALKVR